MSDYVAYNPSEMAHIFLQCSKCRVGMGTALLPESMLKTYRPMCDDCKRIAAWVPEIVAAVVAAMKESA